MACNRDEAIRVRDMAERKFAMQDFVGAKECLIKAQQLFPRLEGATEMLAALDARIAAHGMTQTDWHDIREAVVRAEAAFKSIGEAFGVLSDKAKKYLHNSKRNEAPEMASRASESAQPTPVQDPHEALVFWTTCPFCQMQYQYLRTNLGYRMLCQKCHKSFLANDINVHSTNGANAFPASTVPHVSGYLSQTWPRSGGVAPGNVAAHVPGGPHSAGVGGSAAAYAPLGLADLFWAKRDRVDAERELQRKMEEEKLQLRREEKLQLRLEEEEALRKERDKVRALEEAVQRLTKSQQEGTRRKAALKTGKEKLLKKRNRDAYDDDEDHKDYGDEENLGDGLGLGSKPAFVGDRLKDPSQEELAERFKRELAAKLGIPTRDSTQVPGAKDGEQSPLSEVCSRVVPDPDFHDFDVDRNEHHVNKNQVWAVFDETDGMPRFYCQVNKVRRDPFTVEAAWLEPIHPFKDTFHWLKERDLSISCGQFKLGDAVDFDSINSFSHLMTIKMYKNGYEIYPRRLEVWAIYRDYDKELASPNADGRVQFRYDFVLIRSDFSAITGGGRVARLEKLAGYKTLWVPKGDSFPLTVKYDLHQFSHRVPALPITEENIKGVPAECLELDPASTPVDDIEP